MAAIFAIVIRKGPKATTMDYVAQRLGMSKRTLYEIFGSKDEMLSEVIVDNRTRHGAKIREIMEKTTNMMEATLNNVMIDAAQKVIVLADSSKFGRRGFSKICDLEAVDMIITDSRVSPLYLEQLRERGIEVTVVDV